MSNRNSAGHFKRISLIHLKLIILIYGEKMLTERTLSSDID